MAQKTVAPIMRRCHVVGTSIVITIAPSLAEKFNANDPLTFFEEVATDEGILLKPRRVMAT